MWVAVGLVRLDFPFIWNGALNGKQNNICIALMKYYVPKVQKKSRSFPERTNSKSQWRLIFHNVFMLFEGLKVQA